MTGTYNYWLVALSFIVAFLTTYRSISIIVYLRDPSNSPDNITLLMGAIILGTGIWLMHFIGMLAFHLPIPILYNTALTLLSGLFAVIASATLLWHLKTDNHKTTSLWGVTLIMGSGISIMHYIGMAAIQMQPPIEYDPWLFALSILLAFAASAVAAALLRVLPRYLHTHRLFVQSAAALCLAIAITGMHYTAMAAAHFRPDSRCMVSTDNLNTTWLLFVVLGGALTILILSLVSGHHVTANRSLLTIKTHYKTWLTPLVAACSLIFTLSVISFLLDEVKHSESLTRFEVQTQQHAAEMQHQMNEYEQLIISLGGLYASSREVDHQEFNTFIQSLALTHQHPALHAAGLLRPRKEAPRNPVTMKTGTQTPCLTRLPFGLHDEDFQAIFRPPSSRADTHPELTLTPALLQALRTSAALDGPVLIQASSSADASHPGHAIALYPVYLNALPHDTPAQRCTNLTGWVYLKIDQHVIFANLALHTYLDTQLYSGDGRNQEAPILHRIASSKPLTRTTSKQPLQTAKQISAFNQVWTLRFTSDAPLTEDGAFKLADFILWGGGLSALLVFLLILLLNKARNASVAAAQALAHELKEKEHLLKTLALQNEKLQEADKAKSRFFAIMAHELRTPLTAILGFTDILIETAQETLNPKQKSHLQYIQNGGQHLLTLVNEGLYFLKLSAGKEELHLDRLEIYPLFAGYIQALEGYHPHLTTALLLEQDTSLGAIWIDSRKMRQCVENLLSNAIKFSPRNPQITLRLKRVAREQAHLTPQGRPTLCPPWNAHAHAEYLQIEVEDHGIGIAEHHFHRLFQPFAQINSEVSRPSEGTGLGLSLIQSLVALMEGGLALSSAPSQGSCFTIWIPWRTQDKTPQAEATPVSK